IYGAAVVWLNKDAPLGTWGAISFSSSPHFPALAGSLVMKPVVLAPRRRRPASNPPPVRRASSAKAIGIIPRSAWTGTVAAVVLDSDCGGCRVREDHVWPQRDEFLRETLPRLHVGSPTGIDPDVAALDPAELMELLPERRQPGLRFGVALGIRD